MTPQEIDTLEGTIDVTKNKAQKFLHFNLSKELAALVLVEDIAEVLHVPKSNLLPIPQMPPCVLGIYNWRDEMLWTIALGELLQLPTVNKLSTDSTISIIVAEIDGQYLGLVVDRVNDIEWHELRSIQSPRAQLFSAQLLPFMQGYLSDGTILIAPRAIAFSPLIQKFF